MTRRARRTSICPQNDDALRCDRAFATNRRTCKLSRLLQESCCSCSPDCEPKLHFMCGLAWGCVLLDAHLRVVFGKLPTTTCQVASMTYCTPDLPSEQNASTRMLALLSAARGLFTVALALHPTTQHLRSRPLAPSRDACASMHSVKRRKKIRKGHLLSQISNNSTL